MPFAQLDTLSTMLVADWSSLLDHNIRELASAVEARSGRVFVNCLDFVFLFVFVTVCDFLFINISITYFCWLI